MKMRARALPPVVVIQERHANHGENFKLFKIGNNKSRRQYVARFLSSEKHVFRYRSMQVSIGQKVKETTYKGSPLAVSRLLHLEGLENPFPRPNRSYNTECAAQEADSASSSSSSSTSSSTILNPPLSFFNLSDAKTDGRAAGSSVESKMKPLDWVSISGKAKDTVLDVTCHPKRLIDFNLLFGSASADNEETDARDDDMPILVIDSTDENQSQKSANDEKKEQKTTQNEKQVKQITSSSQRAQVNLPPPPQSQMGPPSTVSSESVTRASRAIEGPNRMLRPRIFPVPYRPAMVPNFADPMIPNWIECPCYHQGGGMPIFSVPTVQRNFPDNVRNIFYNDWHLVPVSVSTEQHHGSAADNFTSDTPSSLHGGDEAR